MPVGGFVINVDPDKIHETLNLIGEIDGVEIHGSDEKGNVVAVLESDTSKEMEEKVEDIMKIDTVLSVGLTYFNAEDEVS
ncbi:MAG: chaperone NapD [Thermodesulfobacteria bacterium]|nr:chaperone NapD [Thermodesulfobacteriota bacterium]